jgi:hypothetical protein
MQPLRVSQLPFVRPEGESKSSVMEREGFVDEDVVKVMVARPQGSRHVGQQSDLVLSAEDLDFAGWSFPTTAATREPQALTVPRIFDELAKEAASPKPLNFARARPTEPETNHRWWLAGLAGVVTTVGFSLILIKLIAPLSFSVPQVKPEKLTESVPAKAAVATAEQGK